MHASRMSFNGSVGRLSRDVALDRGINCTKSNIHDWATHSVCSEVLSTLLTSRRSCRAVVPKTQTSWVDSELTAYMVLNNVLLHFTIKEPSWDLTWTLEQVLHNHQTLYDVSRHKTTHDKQRWNVGERIWLGKRQFQSVVVRKMRQIIS